MRRALTGIVPDEILNRRRKAYVARSPLIAISNEWDCLRRVCEQLLSGSLGVVNSEAFAHALERARVGHEIPVVIVKRTLCIELWLRSAANSLTFPQVSQVARSHLSPDSRSSLVAKRVCLAT